MLKILSKMAVLFLVLTSFAQANSDLTIIDYKKAKNMFNAKSALFMDARGMKLYKKGTILGAVHVPNKQLGKNKKIAQRLPADKKTKIVTFCNGVKCEESDFLAKKLMDMGYTKVYVYKGGYPEWKKKKQPLMGLLKECKDKPTGPYKPKGKAVTINGAKVYLGGESPDDGMIDQFWFAELVNSGKVPANIQLVDVRKASQYEEGHIKGAINVSWDSKAEEIDASKLPQDKLVVFYCNTGMQSTDARGSLDEEIAEKVLVFDANVECEKGKCKVTPNEN